MQTRYALCNELFVGWDHARLCQCAAKLGYQGLELAPYTLAPRITDVTPAQRRIMRRQAEEHGLCIIGFHWLLAKTEHLTVTSADALMRRCAADYLIELARCCRDLGGTVLVFGSPEQRRLPPGSTHEQAAVYALDTFQRALPSIADCGVTLCLEPLAPSETDFINTCAEAVAWLDRLHDPHGVLHLDVKAMATEETSIPDLIRRYGARAGHFHANDANGSGPGFGSTNFVPIFRALGESGYRGWISVEIFDHTLHPEMVAQESLRYMQDCMAQAIRYYPGREATHLNPKR